MMLTNDDLTEFATIWLEEFHEQITEKQAALSGSLLLELCFLLASLPDEEDAAQPQE